MKKKNAYIALLIILIALFFIVNYNFIDNYLIDNFNFDQPQEALIDRVIDGDTIKSDELSIRLLGINSPEKGENYYDEARIFLEKMVFNKTVRIEFGKDLYDKYDRLLAYVFVVEENEKINVNLEMIENGFANPYFPSGEDKYYSEFTNAWSDCIDSDINLCKASNNSCKDCFELTTNLVRNICDINCSVDDFTISPQGRERFKFKDRILKPNEYALFELELNNNFGTGDTIYLRDDEGKLILWKKV